jgi:tetratricopeptide (TPR) repeat protein
VVDVKRDASGNVVRSRLDEAPLKNLARRTLGGYFTASRPGGELPRLLAALGNVGRAGRGQRLVERPVARFPWLALVAVVLLAIERGRPRRRREMASETPMHTERTAAAAAAAALAALVLLAAFSLPARAQSPWARGDRAFKAGRYAEAESLYARRLQGRGKRPPAVEINRATAGAMAGGEVDSTLEALSRREDDLGNAAGYNHGTLLGQRDRYDPALASLRRVLERDPEDQDARWNYEVLASRKEAERKREQERQNPERPKPEPSPSSGGGGSQPQQQGSNRPAPQQSSPQSGTSPPSPSQGSGMTRNQADRLLNALQDLARADQQRQRKVQVVKERQGRDW